MILQSSLFIMVSLWSISSLMIRPSRAESRLNTGTSLTLGFTMDSMSLSATPPAVIMPKRVPSSRVTGTADRAL